MKSFLKFFESKYFSLIRFFSVSFIVCYSSFAISQGINFELVYGTQSFDDAKCIIQTFDSGYVVAGTTSGFGNGTTDMYLTKISKAGNVTWQQAIGGAGIDIGRSVIQTPDSGYAIAGYTNSFGNGGYDVYLVRTDKNGALLWSKTYGGSDWDFGNSIAQTANGDYVICGETYSYGNGNKDVYLLKTNSSGILLWDFAYGGTSEDVGMSVCESTDATGGGYFITGYTKSFGQGNEDVYLIKTNADGNTAWTKTYGGTGEDTGSEGKQTIDGGYIIICTTKSFSPTNHYEYWLIKTDSNGDTLWASRIAISYNRLGISVCQTTDGGYIVGGNLDAFGQYDMYLLKIDGGGNYQNIKTYGGLVELENIFSVKQTFDGGYVIVGVTESYGMGTPNIYVLKTGSDLLSTGNVVIVVGMEENEPSNNKIFLYPNPASDYFNLNIEASSLLEIFDSMGKRISVVQIFKGNNTIKVSGFPDGIYFIMMRNEKQSASAKIIIRH